MDLVILAGGTGSRFGGLKQVEPIDNNGNFIMDYSIFDAIRAGFNKVVFVIKKDNLKDFKSTIGKRLEGKVDVEYVFQDLNSFVDEKKYNIIGRTKPFGTAHAVLCAKDVVKDNFAIINADDFYGLNSFKQIANFLKKAEEDNNFAMVAYKVINTLTEGGEVKRGICKIEEGTLQGFEESLIKQDEGKIFAKPINALSKATSENREIEGNTLVSMNLFGFTPKVFELLEQGFSKFLEDNRVDLQTCEYFIPTMLTENINKNKIKISVLETDEKWFGLTYKLDAEEVKKGLQELTDKNIYPKNLWKK